MRPRLSLPALPLLTALMLLAPQGAMAQLRSGGSSAVSLGSDAAMATISVHASVIDALDPGPLCPDGPGSVTGRASGRPPCNPGPGQGAGAGPGNDPGRNGPGPGNVTGGVGGRGGRRGQALLAETALPVIDPVTAGSSSLTPALGSSRASTVPVVLAWAPEVIERPTTRRLVADPSVAWRVTAVEEPVPSRYRLLLVTPQGF